MEQQTYFSDCNFCRNVPPPKFAIAAKTHVIRQRGVDRRLCTACVLKTNPSYFCPVCYEVYEDNNPPPATESVMCTSCTGIVHSTCAYSLSTGPYRCPACTNPNHAFFKIVETNVVDVVDENGVRSQKVALTTDLAKQLYAAAKISANSLNKAAKKAREEMEKKAQEAAVARREAKEALEHFYQLTRNDHSSSSDDHQLN